MKEDAALIEQASREPASPYPDVPAHEKTGLDVLRRILLIYAVLALCIFACVRCAGEPPASIPTSSLTPESHP